MGLIPLTTCKTNNALEPGRRSRHRRGLKIEEGGGGGRKDKTEEVNVHGERYKAISNTSNYAVSKSDMLKDH